MYRYIDRINQFTVYLKLKKHCKSTILQLKKQKTLAFLTNQFWNKYLRCFLYAGNVHSVITFTLFLHKPVPHIQSHNKVTYLRTSFSANTSAQLVRFFLPLCPIPINYPPHKHILIWTFTLCLHSLNVFGQEVLCHETETFLEDCLFDTSC